MKHGVQTRSAAGFIGRTLLHILLLGTGVLCLLPILHLLAVSLSGQGPANANMVGLWPVDPTLLSYKEVFQDQKMLSAFLMSLLRVILGVSVNMLLTTLAAYPLSFRREQFPGRNTYSGILLFTMLFSGGMIPSYILINSLGLMNSIWALILPGVPVFNVIIMMNFFGQIPEDIKEAALIDGAGHHIILAKIFVPLSVSVFATLTLFCFVGHWNAWFDALIYIEDSARYPLQTYIQTLLARSTETPDLEEAKRLAFLSRRALLFARIFVSIIPIIVFYPYLQKYYQSGLILGAVKG